MAGPNRRDQLKALFTTPDQPVTAPSPVSAPETKSADRKPADFAAATKPVSSSPIAPASPQGAAITPPRSASGAVKAMGLSLGGMSRELDEARRLKESLTDADRVVLLDPALVDGSFVMDRLGGTDERDEAFNALVESLRVNGQQVPILVRPHPDKPGRFQAAYGHRRLAASQRLGVPVRAIVRGLNDTELVLAQGKENSERRDLSFIERALFAKTLMDRGFDRAMVIEALSLHKTEISRFVQVAEAIPLRLIHAIGPAPKVGRPRWMALVELVRGTANEVKAIDETTTERFRAADSDGRFDLVFRRLSARKRLKTETAKKAGDIMDRQGRAFARLDVGKARSRIEIDSAVAPGFAEFVASRLPDMLQRFSAAQGPETGEKRDDDA